MSEILGHSGIGITLDLYSHVMPPDHSDAADAIGDAIEDAIGNSQATNGDDEAEEA